MTFLTWGIAAIAASIAIPALIILYFLKLRRRDLEVSTTLLWKKAIQDLQANAPFQKLRNNILLILQLLALAAALLAISQPEFKDRGRANTRQIIMIDRSASMSASDGAGAPAAATPGSPASAATPGITRLEAAKKKAIEFVDGLREPGLLDDKAEEAMVIAFDTSADVLQNFTARKADLKAAIEAIQPTDAPSSLDRAFTLAKAYTGTQKFDRDAVEKLGFIPHAPGATMHLFSDGRLPDADKIQTSAEDVVIYHAVGSKDAPNIGVTGLRAERAFDNPGHVSVFVGLQSTDHEIRKVDVELSVDGVMSKIEGVNVNPATAPPPTETDDPNAAAGDWKPGLGGFVFPLDRVEGGVASVHITSSGNDVLPNDNAAYVIIPPAKRLSVCVVSEGNLFIRTALEGMTLSRLDTKKPAEFQKLLDDGQTAQYDVFIFEKNLPQVKNQVTPPAAPAAAPGAPPPTPGAAAPSTPAPPPAAKKYGLPPGRSLVLGIVPPAPLGAIDNGPGDPAVFVDWQRDHPALRLAALDKVSVAKSRKVAVVPDTPVKVLARDQQGPAILEVSDSQTEAIIVPFDVADTDWPFDPGWVLFLASSVLYLSDSASGAVGETVHVGDTMTTRLPSGSSSVRITLPDRTVLEKELAPDNTVSYGPIVKSGVYTVSWVGQATAADTQASGRVRRPIAANLLDPAESDLGTRDKISLARDSVGAEKEHKTALTRKLWPWLLLAALVVVMFEWFIYNRKVAI